MINEQKVSELKALVQASGESFDFGGLPLPDIFDSLEKLWKVYRAARKWTRASQGKESVDAEDEMAQLIEQVNAELGEDKDVK